MCGICGKYNFERNQAVQPDILEAMTEALHPRGPDQQGSFIHGGSALGVRRLIIIDPAGGAQPMFNEDKTVALVCNGEIYNYPELKNRLSAKGHIFRSKSDSEAIIHLYEEEGEGFVRGLRGMFALALADIKRNIMIVSRDRFGIKPLYYALTKDGLVFSSAARSLLREPQADNGLDRRALNCYFTYNYFPEDFTAFSGIKKLLPGHYIVCKNGGCEIKKYWGPERCQESGRTPTHKEQLSRFREIFAQTISLHLASDVPIGVFLSGGMDSAAILLEALKNGRKIDTFSLGFQEPTFDERRYASQIARITGVRHHNTVITDIIPSLMKMVASSDLPMGEASLLPTCHLSEFARGKAGVVLSGEGADELFGGYETYQADQLAETAARLPRFIKKGLFGALIDSCKSTDQWMDFKLKAGLFFRGINCGRIPHYTWREIFSEEDKQELYSPELLAFLKEDGYLDEPYLIFERNFYSAAGTSLERALDFDMKVWLPCSILQRSDMASMAHSLEVRVPYLDNEVADFAFRLPLKAKIRGRQGKLFLKEAFRKDIPSFILNRPKHGFSVPSAKWLRHELKDFCQSLFNDPAQETSEFLNPGFVRKLFQEHLERKKDNSRQLWNIMVFMLWIEEINKT